MMTYTPEPYQPVQPTTPGPVPAPVKPKRRWPWVTLAAVVALIVGTVIGSAGASGTTPAAAPKPKVETHTVTRYVLPAECVDALKAGDQNDKAMEGMLKVAAQLVGMVNDDGTIDEDKFSKAVDSMDKVDPTNWTQAAQDCRDAKLDASTRSVADPTPRPTVTVRVPGPKVTVTVRPKAPAKPKRTTTYHDTIPGDGTFLVGKDIAAGTFRSKPASGGIGMCSWERMSGMNSTDDFIDGDVSQGQVLVTIEPGDKAFKTSGCQTWHRVN